MKSASNIKDTVQYNTKFVILQESTTKITRPSHKKWRMESKRSESRRAESIWDLIEAFLW